MFKNAFVVVATILLGSASVAAFAHGGGGGGGSAHSGGMSSQHISSTGLKNTNGPDAADRDKGLQRAGDRMNREGLSHDKAHKAHTHKSKIRKIKHAEGESLTRH